MLQIPHHIFERMVEQAAEQAPVEACGILAGKDDCVEVFHEMVNSDNSPEHFMFQPKEQFEVVKKMRAAGHEMLAIYHSHPASPARPSEEDIRLALTPDVVYVILSLAGDEPVVKGFSITEGEVNEVPVRIAPA